MPTRDRTSQMIPALALGAKIGPTRSWLLASNSGCSGAPSKRSWGLALKTTVDWKTPTSACTPAPMRRDGIGL